MDKQQLLDSANEIKTETIANQNSATRIGTLFADLITAVSAAMTAATAASDGYMTMAQVQTLEAVKSGLASLKKTVDDDGLHTGKRGEGRFISSVIVNDLPGNNLQCDAEFATVCGNANKNLGSNHSFLSGKDNATSNAHGSLVGGMSNVVENCTSATVLGRDNEVKSDTVTDHVAPLVSGAQNYCHNSTAVLMAGIRNRAESAPHGFVVGSDNVINAREACATGKNNIVDAMCATAFGYKNEAHAPYSLALGYANRTDITSPEQANEGAIAMGCLNVAKGPYSMALGTGCTTSYSNEVALGRYNISRETGVRTMVSVGCGRYYTNGAGEQITERVNAIEIDANKNIYLIGLGQFDGVNRDSATPLGTILADMTYETTSLSLDVSQCKRDVTSVGNRTTVLERSQSNQDSRLTALDKKTTDLNNASVAQAKEISTTVVVVKDLKQRVMNAESEVAAQHGKVAKLETSATTMAKEIDTNETNILKLTKQQNTQAATVADHTAKMEVLTANVATAQRDIEKRVENVPFGGVVDGVKVAAGHTDNAGALVYDKKAKKLLVKIMYHGNPEPTYFAESSLDPRVGQSPKAGNMYVMNGECYLFSGNEMILLTSQNMYNSVLQYDYIQGLQTMLFKTKVGEGAMHVRLFSDIYGHSIGPMEFEIPVADLEQHSAGLMDPYMLEDLESCVNDCWDALTRIAALEKENALYRPEAFVEVVNAVSIEGSQVMEVGEKVYEESLGIFLNRVGGKYYRPVGSMDFDVVVGKIYTCGNHTYVGVADGLSELYRTMRS